jgi:hypothetical protein
MMTMKRTLSFIAVFLFPILPCSAQSGDTVQVMMLRSILPDTTIFSFQLGEIALLQPGTSYFINFADTGSPSTTAFFVSQPFIVSSSADTVSFHRTMNFDNNQILKADVDTSDHAALDSVINSWMTIMQSRVITPNSSYFSSSSFVKLITVLRKSSDSSVVMVLDTVNCYVNLSGQLRFSTTKNTTSIVTVPISGISSPTAVYLQTYLIDSLPSGSNLTYYPTIFAEQAAFDTATCGLYQDNCSGGGGALKPIVNLNASPIGFAITQIEPNPASAQIAVSISVDNPGNISCEILNIIGRQVQSLEQSVGSGNISINFDIKNLQSGTYFVRITDGIDVATKEFIINH